MGTSGPEDLQLIVDKIVTEFPAIPRSPLEIFLTELLRWNPQLGLISKRDPIRVVLRLFRESIELKDLVAPATTIRIADVGSGGGFPGVAWALMEQDWRFVLIERREGKASFLQAVSRAMNIANAEVFLGQAADAARVDRYRAHFDVVVAMAVGQPQELAPEVEPLLRPGGQFMTTIAATQSPVARIGKRLRMESRTKGLHGGYVSYRLV